MARNTHEDDDRKIRRHKYNQNRSPANYSKVDGQRALELLEILTTRGLAVRFGKSRDGGAYAVGVYGDGQAPYTDFLKPDEDIIQYLRELEEATNPA